MSIVITYPFTNPSNFALNNAAVSGGVGKLGFVPKTGLTFNQAFASDAGFTYNAALAEFVSGLVRQKLQTLANATFFASYNATINGSYGDGVLTATLNGTPTPSISGGRLVLTGGTNRWVTYAAVGNAPNTAIGCQRIRVRPNYSGTPTNTQIFCNHSAAGGTLSNGCMVLHTNAGQLQILIRSAGGADIINVNLGAWSPVAGTTYELELNWDLTAGATRLFLDGVQFGATQTQTSASRGAAVEIRIGSGANTGNALPDFEVDEYVVFSTVQHTTNYTPAAHPAIYPESKVDLPNFSYSLVGAIQAITNLVTTEVGTPRYILEGQYWNGSAWVVSNGTYAQANSKATIVANLGTLNVVGETVISLSAVFGDSDIQSSVDDLTLTYTGQGYAAEGSLLTNSGFVAQEISAFSATFNEVANTTVRFIANVNAQDKYWNGSAWVNSNGSAAQANTFTDFMDNIDTLLGVNSTVKLKVVLTSTNDQVTPDISVASFSYDFGAIEPAPPTQAHVFGFLKDAEGQPVVGATVSVQPNRELDTYVEAADRIITKVSSKVTDANGFFAFNLIISDDYEVEGAQPMQYKLSIQVPNAVLPIFKRSASEQVILFTVPNSPEVNITDQIGAV